MEDYKERNEVYSKSVRAGKRTYFFDVKSTKSDEYYLTITESKRRFNNENGKFFYEKHKLFLYKEDFEKFSEGLTDVISFIKKEQEVVERTPENSIQKESVEASNTLTDVSFEDLGDKSDADDTAVDDANNKSSEDDNI
ncbi:MAG: DUF3276 family protein [Bacteroidales bacterium]|nr:DUF3276 family protein [Bacteroidales bacterium]